LAKNVAFLPKSRHLTTHDFIVSVIFYCPYVYQRIGWIFLEPVINYCRSHLLQHVWCSTVAQLMF